MKGFSQSKGLERPQLVAADQELPMMRVIPILFAMAILVLPSLLAQSLTGPTEIVWALDAGSQPSTSPIFRLYAPGGIQVGTAAIPGSGSARGFCFDPQGNCYVARGDLVYRINANATPSAIIFTAPSGGSQAQDCIYAGSGANARLIVAFGASALTSRIGIYGLSGGAPLTTISGSILSQPRRLAISPFGSSTTVYVANRDANNILSFDYTVASPTPLLLLSLAGSMIGPVGLCFDAPNDRLWVASDWGQMDAIGHVLLPAAASFSQQIALPPTTATGLRAAAGCCYDRYRRLYVAGRSVNTGTAGVYIFSGEAVSSTPAFLMSYPASGQPAPSNVIDVEVQPSDIQVCAPLDGATPVLANNQVNRVVFSAPAYPMAVYAAAISFRWTVNCGSPIMAGSSLNSISLGTTDPRAIPLANDILFTGSAGLGSSGQTPPLGGMPLTGIGIAISDFIGLLDANGTADAFINLSLTPALDGTQLSLCFVTVDSGVPSGFGFISESLCVTIRETPGPLTLCP